MIRAMPRLLLAIGLSLASVAVFLSSACSSSTEGCLAGSCTGSTSATGTGGSGGAGAATTTGSGTGGAGAAAACSTTPQTGDFPCDVFAVIHAQCNPCHQTPTKNGAPFPLLTYADTQQPYGTEKLIFQQMYDQIGPNGVPRMPLNGKLSDADYATLRNWLAACAPPAAAGMGCGCPGNGCN